MSARTQVRLATREYHPFEAAGRQFLYMAPSAAVFGIDETSAAVLDALGMLLGGYLESTTLKHVGKGTVLPESGHVDEDGEVVIEGMPANDAFMRAMLRAKHLEEQLDETGGHAQAVKELRSERERAIEREQDK